MNTYHKVVKIIPAKACVLVEDITGLDVNSRVMIIQMKGAVIDVTNTSSFGTVTAMNEAGNYEIGTVCYIKDDSVFLFHNLLNTYNTTSGKVQLVQFGEYFSANVADTVKAAPWDSAAGTGGVIAIFADQDITVNSPIYADSSGYSGGAYLTHSGDCNPIVGTGYFYDPASASSSNGAYKGEGINTVSSASFKGGKGASANGGGGGNNHNNSGGGGANLAAGGTGGRNSSSGPFNCNLNNNSGAAGWALNSSSGTKIFLGGGGGAGHANNGSALMNYGGNGGGIVFIWATNVWGTGTISANGGKGGASTSDGAGGGGAGGTIIMNVSNYSAAVTMKANGGDGGLSDNSSVNNRCFGGGGGGSGGVIYFSGPVHANAFVDGGVKGNEINSLGTCSIRPGVDGTDGITSSGYVFSRSTDPAGYCRMLLPVQLISFSASRIDKKVLLKWELGNPSAIKWFVAERSPDASHWSTIRSVAPNDQAHHYTMIDEAPAAGKNYYRIRFVEVNTNISYSPTRLVITGDRHEFSVYPNPANGKIVISGNFITPADMKILDLAGKLIYKKKIVSATTEVDLSHLPAGIYMLWLNQSVQKIMIR
ncbi:MAG TPA: T9SS type A sorting domain-containing protein [Chitinophagaceae bacterium]|nr:T9SS type A sorting domain-containing protein [Chitinophagaceae bacterium]